MKNIMLDIETMGTSSNSDWFSQKVVGNMFEDNSFVVQKIIEKCKI